MCQGPKGVDQVTAYVGLGSNLGGRVEPMQSGLRLLSEKPSLQIVEVSPVYETDAVGGPEGQPSFLNAVAKITTGHDCRTLLLALLEVEKAVGRVRTQRFGPRILDLDLLLYGDKVVEEEGLVVPHPRMVSRRFVLQPLSDLNGKLWVPGVGRSVAALLSCCTEGGMIKKTEVILWP